MFHRSSKMLYKLLKEKNREYMHKKVLQQIYIRKKYIQNIQKYMQK